MLGEGSVWLAVGIAMYIVVGHKIHLIFLLSVMVGKIFLFTGEDHFRLHEELKRWRTQFAEKYGNDSVVVFDVHADVVTIAHAVSGG